MARMTEAPGKYDNKVSPAAARNVRILPRLQGTASRCLAASLSASSWLQLDSVGRKLKATARQLGLDPTLPMEPDTILNITIAWIAEGLRGSTIRTYAGV